MCNVDYNEPKMVLVHLFKPSGKWSDTVELSWDNSKVSNYILDAFNELMVQQYPESHLGLTAVCIDPHHEHAHPLSIQHN